MGAEQGKQIDEASLRSYSLSDISRHNTKESLWVIVDGLVYDLTKFAPDHPGGVDLLLKYAGGDGSKKFHAAKHDKDSIKESKKFIIGKVKVENNQEKKTKA